MIITIVNYINLLKVCAVERCILAYFCCLSINYKRHSCFQESFGINVVHCNLVLPILFPGMKSKYLNENCVDFKPLCYHTDPFHEVKVVAVGAISGFNKSEAQVKINNDKAIDLESIEQTFKNVILAEVKEKVGKIIDQLFPVDNVPSEELISSVVGHVCTHQLPNEITSLILDVTKHILPMMKKNSHKKMNTNDNNANEDIVYCSKCADMYQPVCKCIDVVIEQMFIARTTSHLSAINTDVHIQHTYLKKTLDQKSLKRTERRVYNQIHISNIPFKPGDSGTCIYTVQPSSGCTGMAIANPPPQRGCIGMAIANHPQSGCIATPIQEILKHFKIKIK